MDTSNMKEWTVMFYFASDNPLAPGVVSQLKAIKQAGFHPGANVVAQFDPQTVGTPTHIFDVNLVNKIKSHGAPSIGFDGDDPFVRNMLEDKLWRDQKNRRQKRLRDELEWVLEEIIKDAEYDPPIPPADRNADGPARVGRSRELSPRQSLENFLRFCLDRYPAHHYMLFILGHGVVVGNDIFLFDEHVNDRTNTLSLVELGEVLATFAQDVKHKHRDSEFELVAFHSCSVSSLEVAYELAGTANYMLASQGPAFVGSWPYREILVRLFKELVSCGRYVNVEELIRKIFFYCLYNSMDFLLAGYSFDLCWCNLNRVKRIKRPLKKLSEVLVEEGLTNYLVRNLILTAHWRAQSFWQESYTDLYDFCFCLHRLCEEYRCLNKLTPESAMDWRLRKIQRACRRVIRRLEPQCRSKQKGDESSTKRRCEDKDRRNKKIIIRAAFTGPAYQYSHGLSVYFPWSRPARDTQILEEYKGYKFAKTCWLDFLEEYFDKTLRPTRKEEEKEDQDLKDARRNKPHDELCKIYKKAYQPEKEKKKDVCKLHGIEHDSKQDDESAVEALDKNLTDPERFQELLEDIASLVYSNEGEPGNPFALSGGKTDPSDPTGDGCTCPSIKNYPRDTRRRFRRGIQAAGKDKRAALISDTLSEGFLKLLDDE